MPGVIDRDRGYASLMKELRALGQSGNPRVYVGILQDDGEQYYESWHHTKAGRKVTKNKITLAGYAAANEFGATTSKGVVIPERSFLRSTMADHQAAYEAELRQVLGAYLSAALSGVDASATLEHRLGRLGLRVESDVKMRIRDLKSPPNAKSTLAKKYPGQNPLVHTARLRQSIAHRVEMSPGVTS